MKVYTDPDEENGSIIEGIAIAVRHSEKGKFADRSWNWCPFLTVVFGKLLADVVSQTTTTEHPGHNSCLDRYPRLRALYE